MRSRITINLDFDNNNEPVIEILAKDSDDVRDNLIKSFYQKLGGYSSWCKITFKQDYSDDKFPDNDFKRIFITPIPANQMEKEGKEMISISKDLTKQGKES